jgi:hypothetical protein
VRWITRPPTASILALAEMRSAVLITQDQRLLKKLESLPNAAGLAMAIEALVITN